MTEEMFSVFSSKKGTVFESTRRSAKCFYAMSLICTNGN